MPERSPRMLELAERLLSRTKAGNFVWTQHSANDAYFQGNIGESVVSIVSRDADGNHPFVLTLWRKKADGSDFEVVEKLSSLDSVTGGRSGWEQGLAELWRRARSQALRVDETIEEALAELSE